MYWATAIALGNLNFSEKVGALSGERRNELPELAEQYSDRREYN
jgi:hypothetical protein